MDNIECLTPIRLIDFEEFSRLNVFPRYPQNKDIVVEYDVQTIDRDNSFIVFISHC